MNYLLIYSFVEDFRERRTPYREEHLKLASEAHARGDLLMAGAFADSPAGAVVVFREDGKAAAEDYVKRDPYVANGVVTEWKIRPWNVAVGG